MVCFFENMELDKWDRLLAGWRINKRLKLGELSTGMLMKVKIGSVLARKAKLYLYDEPLRVSILWLVQK